jgi:ribosomal protein S18 acetylase RimI-like enzyme
VIAFRDVLRAADRAAIERITQSSGFFSPAELLVALEVFDDALRDAASGYRFHLAEVDGAVVGYACWGKDTLTESSFELYWIAIDDGWRGHGIGRRLGRRAEAAVLDEAPAGAQLFAETAGREQYLPTRRFYEREGYRQVAVLPDYYAPGDDMVVYCKRLSPGLPQRLP